MSDPNALNERWLARERNKVAAYLEAEGCHHGGVAKWPAFAVNGQLALWGIQSTKHTGRVGWWAISGDLPTDYMSSGDGNHPREALRHFAAEWWGVADYMRRGERHPLIEFGEPESWPAMAEELEQRAAALQEYAEDDAVWTNQP